MRFCLTPTLSVLLLTSALSLPAWADVRIRVDKSDQRMTVMVDGQTRYTWPVSTGMDGYDTPDGSYRPSRMERDYRSKEWDDAPMPHAIFFTPRGHAIHATNHTRQLGRPASHGCVRLSPKNAAALFSLVKSQGMANTHVAIEGDGAALASRSGEGFKTARGKRRYYKDGVMSAGMQMGRDSNDGYYEPNLRRGNYRQSGRYEYRYRNQDIYTAPYVDELD
jgi:hypothetical protein